jgi:protein phosphatase
MSAMSEIVVPAAALVVLVGVSGSGKSTFAAANFEPTEVLSSDAFRAMVADDPTDQRASRAAFELLHLAAHHRLARGRLTVVDATSVTRRARSDLLGLASATHRPAVAIVLDPPLAVCLARNADRVGRTVDDAVIQRQHDALRRSLASDPGLGSEGFASVQHLTDLDPRTDVMIVRTRTRGDGGG